MVTNQKVAVKNLLLMLTVLLPAFSTGVPHLDIAKLVNTSDVIVIADVSPARMVGEAPPVPFNNQSLPAHGFEVVLKIQRFIKGKCPKDLTVRYILPDSYIGYSRLQTGLRMVFLRSDNNEYVLANRSYPELPAASGESKSPNIQDDPLTAVFHELADVVASPVVAQDRWLVLQEDYAIPSSDYFTSAVKRGIAAAPDSQTREFLQGELLRREDLSELPRVSRALSASSVTPEGKNALLYAIGNRIKDPRAVPELLPLLSSTDSAVREAAAEALWHIADPKTVADIAHLLNDSDTQVRYYATRALAEITGENLWGPGGPEYEENGARYVQHWRDWAREKGYIH